VRRLEIKARCVQSILGFWYVGRIESPGWRKQLNWLHEVSALLSRLTGEHGGAKESAIGEIAKRCGSFCDEIASRQDIEPKG
jgi:hypothetical protein